MIFLRMMTFVEYHKADLVHSHKGMRKTVVNRICSGYNDHFIFEVGFPGFNLPAIDTHLATILSNFNIEIAF